MPSNNAKFATGAKLGARLTRSDAPVTAEDGATLMYPHEPGTLVHFNSGIATYVVAGAAGATASASLLLGASFTASTTTNGTHVNLASASVPANYGFWARTSAGFPV